MSQEYNREDLLRRLREMGPENRESFMRQLLEWCNVDELEEMGYDPEGDRINAMTTEELDEELRSQGVDTEELARKTQETLKQLRAKLSIMDQIG